MQYLKHLQSELKESLWKSHRKPNDKGDCRLRNSSSENKSIHASSTSKERTKALDISKKEEQTIKNQECCREKEKKIIEAGESVALEDEIRSYSIITNSNRNNNKTDKHLEEGVHTSLNPHSKLISSLRATSSFQNKSRAGEGSSLVEPVILSLTPLSKSVREEYYNSRSSSLDKEEYHFGVGDHFESRPSGGNNVLVVVDDPLLHLLGVGPLVQEETKDEYDGLEKQNNNNIIFVTSGTSSSSSITFPEGKVDKGRRRSSIAISNIYSTRSPSNIFQASRQIHSSRPRERCVDNANRDGIQTISKVIQDREEETGYFNSVKDADIVPEKKLFTETENREQNSPQSLPLSTEAAGVRTEQELDFQESLAPEDLHSFASRFATFTRNRGNSSSDSCSRSSSGASNRSDSTNSDSTRTTASSIPESEYRGVVLLQEEGETNAPVEVTDSEEATFYLHHHQKFGLPLPRISSVAGLSCSYKVNQKKRSSGSSNNNNNNSDNASGSINVNSEIITTSVPRVTKRGSIIQYLLCTKGLPFFVCTPKNILHSIFSPAKRKERKLKRRQSKRGKDQLSKPLFQFCPCTSSVWSGRANKKSNAKRKRKNNQKLKKLQEPSKSKRGSKQQGLKKSELKLWVTMDHEDLIRELPNIEKLSNQERLRLAHKRRMLQLKKFQQYEKDLNSNSKKHRGESDLVRRNLPSKQNIQNQHYVGRKGSRRIRFRNSIMLLEAAGRNDVEEVRLLLESGVNPDVANEDGLTALHQCCIDDNEEMMKLLLDYGANVNAEDSEKWTPLHAAATCGHLHLVQYLIARGANLLAVNAEGNMPYDICDDETTLDYIESEMAKRGVTQELIEEIRALPETKMLQEMQRIHAHGGDLECRDPDGATPLHVASANGYYRVAEFLLDNHAATDVQDKDFWQPIHAAACWGHLDVLELLVQNGADLDARTKNNETPYAICEDPEIKERIIQLRTEQQSKRQNEGRKRPSRTHSTNSRTQSIRRTSQRDKGLTSKRDAADEAQMLRAREELHKENSPSPTSDAVTGANNNPKTTSVTLVNGNGVDSVAGHNNGVHQNGNTSSEEDPELTYPPPPILGRDSISNMKMKHEEMNRLREIAVRSGAVNHNNQLNNQNNIHNNTTPGNNTNNAGIKMNNLLYNESNGSLLKNQSNIQKNLNNASNGAPGNAPVGVLSSPDDNGNLLPKPEINPSVDNKVPLGGGLSSGMSLSGSRDNLVGLSSSAGNSTIDIHVSVTINTNSPVSTLTNGGSTGPGSLGLGHGHHSPASNHIPLSPGSTIFTPPGTLSDLKKQRSLIRTSSNPLTNGGINDVMTKYHPPASPTMSLRRYVGDPAETVGDYGDGGKRCCVIV